MRGRAVRQAQARRRPLVGGHPGMGRRAGRGAPWPGDNVRDGPDTCQDACRRRVQPGRGYHGRARAAAPRVRPRPHPACQRRRPWARRVRGTWLRSRTGRARGAGKRACRRRRDRRGRRRARAPVEPVRARGRPPGLCGRVRLRGPGHPGGGAAGTAARRPRGTSRGGPVRHRTHPVLRHPLQGTAPHARRHPRRGHRDGRERRLLLHPLGRDAQVDRLRASWRRRLLADPSRHRHPPPRLAPRGRPRGGERRLRGHDRHLRGHASLRGHGFAS